MAGGGFSGLTSQINRLFSFRSDRISVVVRALPYTTTVIANFEKATK